MNAPTKPELLLEAGVVDYVTVLQCAKSLRLTKTWQADGTIRSSDKVKTVRLWRPMVRSFAGMCKLLDLIATRSDRGIIRAAPREEYPADAPLFRDKCHFVDEPHYWVIFDVDDYVPSVDPVANPEAAVEEFITKELPECFQYRSCRWMLSSSAGKPGKAHLLKAHLMFWCTRPYTSAQLKLWVLAKRLKVDFKLFDPVQWHYMSDPIFEPGVVDPVEAAGSKRYGVIPGFEHEVDLLIEEGLVREANARSAKPDGERNDPKQKRGVVGAFCRAFDIDDCFERWGAELPYVQEHIGDSRRLTYTDSVSETPGGAYITDCRQWLGNTHANTPYGAERVEVNAFDLMRVHRYGELDADDEDMFAGDATRGPSFNAMKAWAMTLPEVQEALQAMKVEEAASPAAPLSLDGEDLAEPEEQGPTVEEIIEKLRKLPTTDVPDAWPPLSADLPPVDLDRVLQEVAKLMGARLIPLKEALRQYKAERRRQRKIMDLYARAAGREIVRYDPMSSTVHAKEVENLILKHLEGNDRQHEYVAFSGKICAMIEDRLPHSHAADDDDPESAPLVPTLRALDRAAFLARAEEVVGFTRENDKGEDKPIPFHTTHNA